MNVIRQLTLRNLRLNRKRTIVTLIGIILSGAMICGVATLVASFQDVMIRSTIMNHGSHHATLYGVAYENTKYAADFANTDQSMLSRDEGFALLEGSKNSSKPYLTIKAYDRVTFNHYPIHLTEGRLPERPDEIVISEGVFLGGGVEYDVGDTLTIEVGQRVDAEGNSIADKPLEDGETLVDLERRTYTVTGVIESPSLEYYSLPAYAAITFLDTNMLLPSDVVDVSITTKQPKHIFDTVNALRSTLQPQAVGTNNELLRWMGISGNSAITDMFETVGLVIILLVVVGSVSVIYNAFAISVSERKKQFGMLSSVGATGRQIRRMVFQEAAFLGFIGIPIGILSGIGGIWATLEVINNIMADSFLNAGVEMRLVVLPETVWISVVFIALTIFLSAFIPAKRASRISPIDAIRLTTDINIKGRKLRTSKIARLLFGIEGTIALKNLKRHRKRYRATVFSLFISIVLFVSFSSFMTYGFASSEMYYESEPFDFAVEKQGVSSEEITELYEQVSLLEAVDRYSIVRRLDIEGTSLPYDQLGDFLQYVFQVAHEDANPGVPFQPEAEYNIAVYMMSVGQSELARYAEQLGFDVMQLNDVRQPKGILVNHQQTLSTPIQEFEPLDISIGETIKLQDERLQQPLPLQIAAISTERPFFESRANVGSVEIIVSDALFDQIEDAILTDPEYVDSGRLYMNVKDDTDLQAFKEEIRTIDARLNPNGYLMVWDTQTNQQELASTKLVISIFLYGFVSLIALIGITNIFNTISTNVALRRREFAMLKSVGMTPAGFNRMLNYECIFYGLKSLLYGLPVAVAVSYWMYSSISGVFNFGFVLPWKEMFICVVAVFIIVFVTMLFSSSKLKKENIIDALKMENL